MGWSRERKTAAAQKTAALRDLATGSEPVRTIAARYGVDPKALRDLERAHGVKHKRAAGRPSSPIPNLEPDFLAVAKCIIKLEDTELIAQLISEELWSMSFPSVQSGRMADDPRAEIFTGAKERTAVQELLGEIRSPASLALVARIFGSPIASLRRDGESAYPKEIGVRMVQRDKALLDAAMREMQRTAPAGAALAYADGDPKSIRLSILPAPNPHTPASAPRSSWEQVGRYFSAVEAWELFRLPLFREIALGSWAMSASAPEVRAAMRWLEAEPSTRWRRKTEKLVRSRIARLAHRMPKLAAQLEALTMERVRKARRGA